MSGRLVRLLCVGLKEDVGFDSNEYYRLVQEIEALDGVRSCRELKSVGPTTLLERMNFLADVRNRIEDSDPGPNVESKERVLRIIDEMGTELMEKMEEVL